MSTEAAFSRTWPVGRYTATLSSPAPVRGETRAAVVEWSPAMPRRLTADELAQYRAGRDAALAALADELRITVAVVDL
jgi:hypothetical protein